MYRILYDDTLVCDSRAEELALLDPVVILEENKAGSFTFTIPPTHPKYNAIKKRKGLIQVYFNDETEPLFSGVCMDETCNFYKNKKIYCEGELTFFNDSIQRPKRYEGLTVQELLEAYIAHHNSQVEEEKRFTVGAVTVKDKNDYISCYTNMESTMQALKEDLTDDLGGIFRIRHEEKRYLDYLADSPNTNTQIVKIGKNLLDFSINMDATNIATAVIPLGAKLEESQVEGLETRLTITQINNGLDYVYNQEAADTYGWIYKVVQWDDVTTPEALKTKAMQYLSNIQWEDMVIEATALDLHLTDKEIERFKISDQIRVVSVPHGMDRYFRLTKMTIKLNNLESSTITLGKTIQQTLSAKINQTNEKVKKAVESIVPTDMILRKAAKNASEIIKFASEGNIHTVYNENGKPIELCIMDTDDIITAKKVWRWTMGGFGYSSSGYDGEYNTAITMDGAIVADFITVGILNAARIKAGILSDENGKNFWNMETGEFQMSSSAKIGNSTVASAKDVENAEKSAVNTSNSATDKKLTSYSTTAEMNLAIDANAQELTASFNKKVGETKIYAENVSETAKDDAIADADEKLKSYSTTTEMENAIKVSAESLTMDFDKKITETKTYADDAVETSNIATDEKLKAYSTVTEMELAISASAESVKSEMSKTVQRLQKQIDGTIETFTGSAVPTLSNTPASAWSTNEIKDTHIGDLYVVNSSGGDYAGFYYRFEKSGTTYQWTLLKDSEVTKALQDAKEANEKAAAVEKDLADNYSTTTEMNSAIERTAELIRQIVASSIKSWDEKEYYIKLYGYGVPSDEYAGKNYSSLYLNQATGEVYRSTTDGNGNYYWEWYEQLDTVQESLSSSFNQTASEIVMEVNKKVNDKDLGTKIIQNFEWIRVAWNSISKFLQFENGGISTYDGEVSEEKLLSILNYLGQAFYRDGEHIGTIGTGIWDNTHRGLSFLLDYPGKYMGFSRKESEDSNVYTAMLTYSRENAAFDEAGWHLGSNLYGHGRTISDIDLANISADGYSGLSKQFKVVTDVTQNSDGSISCTYGTIKVRHGIMTIVPSSATDI